MDWTAEKAREAEAVLCKWKSQLDGFESSARPSEASDSVLAALRDDLNTPLAISRLHALSRNGDLEQLYAGLLLMGLAETWPDELYRDIEAIVLLQPLKHQLEDLRAEAMQTKNFAEVDRLKAALLKLGVEVRVSKAGVELLPGPNFDPTKLEGME
jgi:cysteinyl-tRNA synthetase